MKYNLLYILFYIGLALQSYSQSTVNDSTILNDSTELKKQNEKIITISGVGDIMFGTNFPSKDYLPPNDNPIPLIKSVSRYTTETDLAFGNLEGAFSNNAKLAKRCKDTTICYAFRMPESYAGALTELGLDVVSLANNHIGDFGKQGKETTKYLLDSLGIEYAGQLTKPYSIFTKDSIKYGFCAFAPNTGTVSINDIPNAKKIVSLLNDSCDIVIVSFHGGAEGSKYQRVLREDEIFYGEKRGNVYKFAHELIDSGADIIFGHGPHVTRAIEVYKNRFIIYSMGNFCTYKRFNLRGANGYAPIVQLKVNRRGEFLSGDIIPIYQNSIGHVKLDPKKQVITKLQYLTKTDFPETKITIGDNGKILYLD